MELTETAEGYRFVYFPQATDTYTKDEWAARGFRVQFGEVRGHAVPKWIEYSKAKHKLESAIAYAKKITECEVCKQLDAQVGVLRIKDQYHAPLSSVAPSPPAGVSTTSIRQLEQEVTNLKQQLNAATSSDRGKLARDLFQKITTDYFRAQLTLPGLVQLAMIFDLPEFLDGVLPEEITPDVESELKAQMGDFFAGDVGMFRSPEQMREWAQLQRDIAKLQRGEPVSEDKTRKSGVKRVSGAVAPQSHVKVIG